MENYENTETTQQTPAGSNNAGPVIGWLDKILSLEAKYGIGKIIMAFMIMFIAIMMGVIAFNPNVIIREITKRQQQAHNEALVRRLEVDPIIRKDLLEMRCELEGTRTFVFETHNGGSNLNNLPFLYVDMTYEEVEEGLMGLESDYKNFRLSRYPFADFIYREQFWCGDVEDIKEIDKELYYRLVNDGAKYIGLMVMYGTFNPAGAVGVTYGEGYEPASTTELRRSLMKYGNKIARLLNNE